jgi:hypothetical protein
MIIRDKNGNTVDINLDEREYKMLLLCIQYSKDPFGAPNDLLMRLVAKLWNYITAQD